MAEAGRCMVADRGVLRLAGPATREFLQGLITNDIARLDEHHGIYAALLTPQGKFLFDFMLHDTGEAILLDCEAARCDELRRRLMMYRLRAAVEIDDVSEDIRVAALWGDGVAARFGLDETPGAAKVEDGVVVSVDPRVAGLGLRLLGTPAALERLVPGIGAAKDDRALERHRIALGVPAAPADILPQKSILLESNFEEMHGVDFNKGCFIGQELTARTKHRALIRKRLHPVALKGPEPEPGTPVMAGEKEVGDLRSVADGHGIAMIRLDAIGGEAKLMAGEAEIEVLAPAWLSAAQAS